MYPAQLAINIANNRNQPTPMQKLMDYFCNLSGNLEYLSISMKQLN